MATKHECTQADTIKDLKGKIDPLPVQVAVIQEKLNSIHEDVSAFKKFGIAIITAAVLSAGATVWNIVKMHAYGNASHITLTNDRAKEVSNYDY